jgi:octaprenyl-diphosphate synthase
MNTFQESSMGGKEELFAFIKNEAAIVDTVIREDLGSLNCPRLPDILNHALFNGGKRVRPMLTLVAARLIDPGLESRTLYQLASVFEYLHVASLLHDDVIDSADQRRGQPAANALWGSTAVILAGDYLHARAMTLAGETGGPACLDRIGSATAAMVEAEFLQMQNAARQSRVTEHYYAVINGKTASLITAACECGALFAGASEGERKALQIYGHNLGLAFQIIDDLLDYLGDEKKTGKTTGNDFVEGKMTLPLIFCLETASREERQRLCFLLEGPTALRREHIDEARQLIACRDGFNKAGRQAEGLIEEAVEQLNRFKDCQAKNILTALAGYVLTRQK